MAEKQKLHYVEKGHIVEWTYLTALVVTAIQRGCAIFQTIQYADTDTEGLNRVIDWLVTNYPEEFEL